MKKYALLTVALLSGQQALSLPFFSNYDSFELAIQHSSYDEFMQVKNSKPQALCDASEYRKQLLAQSEEIVKQLQQDKEAKKSRFSVQPKSFAKALACCGGAYVLFKTTGLYDEYHVNFLDATQDFALSILGIPYTLWVALTHSSNNWAINEMNWHVKTWTLLLAAAQLGKKSFANLKNSFDINLKSVDKKIENQENIQNELRAYEA